MTASDDLTAATARMLAEQKAIKDAADRLRAERTQE